MIRRYGQGQTPRNDVWVHGGVGTCKVLECRKELFVVGVEGVGRFFKFTHSTSKKPWGADSGMGSSVEGLCAASHRGDKAADMSPKVMTRSTNCRELRTRCRPTETLCRG